MATDTDFRVGETKYIFTKFSGLDGKTQASWNEENSDFQIRVSHHGIWFEGTMRIKLSENKPQLQDFAELVGRAWNLHERLRPKIITRFNG